MDGQHDVFEVEIRKPCEGLGGNALLHTKHIAADEGEAGIYTWSLVDDRVYADTAMAALFGLEAFETIRGMLPICHYLERIHQDDRRNVAQLIAQAVKDGEPYRTEYRVRNALNEYEQVMAVGRCFRDPTGNPTLYSGIVYPIRNLV